MDTYDKYPPRFTIEVSGAEAVGNSFMDIQFDGLKKQMKFQLHLCIPSQASPLPKQISRSSFGSEESLTIGSETNQHAMTIIISHDDT